MALFCLLFFCFLRMMVAMFIAIITFIAVLAVLVIAHEFGHFFVARKAGIHVEEFGFGFPPRLWACKGKICDWSVNWLPFGGFVKLKGEDGSNREKDSYAAQGPWTRAAVVAAGPIMNFVLAGVLFSFCFMIGAPDVISRDMPAGARVSDAMVRVVDVLPDSAAERLGFLSGDVIVGVSTLDVLHAADITDAIRAIPQHGVGFDVTVKRVDGVKIISVPADAVSADNPVLGIGMVETGVVRYGFVSAIAHGFEKMFDLTRAVVSGLYQLLFGLVSGSGISADVAGPVGIAAMTGEVAKLGFAHLIQFMALLSVNLGVLNLTPFPVLDGGRLFFIAIELLVRKPVSKRIEQTAHIVGFATLMIVVLVVTVKDIFRFL